ncbi:hypothetical protein BN946_scf184943.g41 [Trametes cinnabarina]|uniref:G-protein coupled receptors family 1 profile domain-containing protein n=1 Tax=Pycnoporus cinnabarinus TaxID=5643 RepID=A0A060SCQ9_PYCCI|nr:hypothetical protein BN946_scf184943.g41 [Trametes cinnabarina]
MSSGADLTNARMSYAAAVLGCMTYGIYLVLAAICIHFLLKRRSKTNSQRIILAYTIVMLFLSTGYFVSATIWSEVEFVESTANIAVFDTLLNGRLAILKDTFYTTNIWLADSMLIYRLYVVWGGSVLIILLPICLWIGAVCAYLLPHRSERSRTDCDICHPPATGIALLVNTAKPSASLVQTTIINFQTAFYCLSITLNILTTLLIAGRLWYQHRQMKSLRAPSAHWDYTSIIAIVIESAALYSICGIIYIPLIVRQLPLQFPITALIGSFTSIAPSLIILRVALGTAVTQETTAKASMIFRLTKLRSDATASTAIGSTAGQSTSGMSGAMASKVRIAEQENSWPIGVVKPGHSIDDIHSSV